MLISGLDKKKYKCILVCPNKGDLTNWASENAVDFAILPLAQPSIKDFYQTFRQVQVLRKWFSQNRIDIAHTADPYCTRAIAIPCALSSVATLSHFHFPFAFHNLNWIFKNIPKPKQLP